MSMDFTHILGNDHIKDYLQRMVDAERIGHSLLFAGPEGVGKSLFALELAKEVIASEGDSASHRHKLNAGNHSDLHIFRPQGKLAMHSIDSLRRLGDQVYMPPTEAAYKVFIIHDADRMLPTSANALLKTFEEPAHHTLIILLASAPQHLLPTIMSRCRKLHFKPIPKNTIAQFLEAERGCEHAEAVHIAGIARGSIGRALRTLDKGGCPIHDALLALLGQGRLNAYSELGEFLNDLDAHCEALKEGLNEEISGSITPEGSENFTAVQRESLQKEVDGAVTLRFREEIEGLLEAVLGWYRDMHLLHRGGDSKLLRHPYVEQSLTQALQRGLLLPLDNVLKVVADARLNIMRSSSVRSCFESMFLRLNFL